MQTTQLARIVTLARQIDNYTPPEPYVLVRLLNMAAPPAVLVDGAPISQVASDAALAASSGDGYRVESAIAAVVVKVIDTRSHGSVEMRL
jgi:alpha-glucosidase